MDPRERADAALARARARGVYVVTPDDAVSPMDASNTVQIPRSVVSAADSHLDEPDSTMVISAGMARGQQPQPQGYPPHGQQQRDNGHPHPHQQQHNGRQQGHPVGHQTGPHQPVPYPGNRQQQPYQQGHPYQSGQHQPVPQPGYQEQPPQEPPAPRQLEGLVPTTQEPAIQRSSLSRRLDGQ
jgi:hypothetical protein